MKLNGRVMSLVVLDGMLPSDVPVPMILIYGNDPYDRCCYTEHNGSNGLSGVRVH